MASSRNPAQDIPPSELEGVRAREWYKYYEPFHTVKSAGVKTPGRVSSYDSGLAVFAQFGALRLNARRVIISCFDRDHQYILAEATRSLSLHSSKPLDLGDDLLLGACVIDRKSMLCERTLKLGDGKEKNDPDEIVIVPDITKEDWYRSDEDHSGVTADTYFYAGIPIRSPTGQVIGTYSVFDDQSREGLSNEDSAFLRHIAPAVMEHLELIRAKEEHYRASKMVVGLGSFVEGKTGEDAESLEQTAQPMVPASDLEEKRQHAGTPPGAPTARQPKPDTINAPFDRLKSPPVGSPEATSISDLQSKMLSTDVKKTFKRAADIIRGAIDIDSTVFYDASVGSFGGLVTSVPASNQDDMNSYFAQTTMSATVCPVLACSGKPPPGSAITEGFLHRMLKRYPQGRIFNFDPNIDPSHVSHAESHEVPDDFGQRVAPLEMQEDDSEARERVRQQRAQDLQDLQKLFPKARSLAFIPMWDDHRMRWFAGGIAWSKTDIRVLHKDSELNFLRAFAISIMSEVAKLDTAMADRAKTNLLNSISHELRSPLHGILGSIECLSDSKLDGLQSGLVETIETCGRTLLDTIDHLLDFSKINNFARKGSFKGNESEPPNGREMLSLDTNVHLPTTTEEALETVFAGYSSFAVPHAQLTASESFFPQMAHHQDVQVILDIEAKGHDEWLFKTEGGAWRRLVLNLAGNALKYTTSGHIHIKLRAEETPSRDGKKQLVTFSVKDTGKGISKEYLENQLYKPFTQENPLNPGTGLGLSMVQQIVTSLGGQISVDSTFGKGTEVRLQINMRAARQGDQDQPSMATQAHGQLKGLKAALLISNIEGESDPSQDLLQDVLGRLFQDWFGMSLITVSNIEDVDHGTIVVVMRKQFSRSKEALAKTQKATVVLCHNALQMQDVFTESESLRGMMAVELISQPFGPRKLARALLACKKWAEESGNDEDVVLPRDTDVSNPKGPVADEMDDVQYQNRPTSPKAPPEPKTEEKKENNDSKPKLRLLLVDDNSVNLQLLVRYCKSKGHDYVTAEDGVEAVNAYTTSDGQSGKIDFVCMDISMPRMDGLEATRRIRSYEREKKMTATKIIALTGLASAEAQHEAFSSGVDLYMTKPVRLKELGDILKGKK